MPRATCRCGQELSVPAGESARIVCPQCGARVRVRRGGAAADGFIRFNCSCGRRLKVPADHAPTHGKCPDCGRVVPVPATSLTHAPGHPESKTEDLSPADLANLERWAKDHAAKPRPVTPPATPADTGLFAPPAEPKEEVGMRVCPKCGKPVHIASATCKACGATVPRK